MLRHGSVLLALDKISDSFCVRFECNLEADVMLCKRTHLKDFSAKQIVLVLLSHNKTIYRRKKELLHRKYCITWSMNTHARNRDFAYCWFLSHVTADQTYSETVWVHHFGGCTRRSRHECFCRKFSLKPWKVVLQTLEHHNYERKTYWNTRN